jgi:DNA mismatch repair protein MutL
MIAEEIAPISDTPIAVPEYRILGEAFNSYVFVESGDRVIVIDKHAAHERVLFEELRARMREAESASQLLMLPIEVMLTTGEIQALENYRKEIEKIGFRFTLKRHSADIDAVPCGISTEAVCDMFITIADHVLHETGTVEVSRDLIFEKALYQASCKAAIKAGREYPADHVKWLVDKLMRLPDITFCPHGRPIAVEMTKNSLDHQFERK